MDKPKINYRTVFDYANDAIFIHDLKDGSIIGFNRKAVELYGYDEEELIKLDVASISEGTPPYSQADAVRNIQQAVGNENYLFEWKAKKKDGSLFWVEVNLKVTSMDNEKRIIAIVRDISARKQTEEELKSQRNRLENILEGTNAGTWEWNLQTGETTINERWADIIGYRLEELSPVSIETWLRQSHPEDSKLINLALEAHFRGETDYYETEYRMKHKAGHWVWILDRGKVISRTDDGQPLWMYGTHQDITDRKGAELALQSENARRRLLMEVSHDGITIINREHQVVEANQRFCQMLGYSLEEALRLRTWDIDATLSEEHVRTSFTDFIKKNQTFETKHRRKDGSTFDVEVSTSGATVDGDTLVVGISRDITERKKAEEELRLHSLVLEQIQDLVTVTDLEGRITYVNDACCQMMGRVRTELIGHHVSILGQDPNSGATQEEILKQTLSKGTWRGLVVNYNARKERVILDCRTRLISDAKGEPLYLCGVSTDITQRKLSEDALRASEEKFAKAFEHTPMLMTISTPEDGVLIDANEAWFRASGYTREEAIGRTSVELEWMSPSQREFFEQKLSDLGSIRNEELTARNKEGRPIHLLFNADVLFIADRRIVLVGAVDITERKKAEEALRESEEKFRSFSEQSLVGIHLIKDGIFTYVNPKFAEIFGYTVPECLDNMHFSRVVCNDDLAMVTEKLRLRVSGKEKTAQYHFKGLTKNGSIIHVEVHGSSVRHRDETVVLGTILDVTQRWQAEEAQRLNAERMEALLTLDLMRKSSIEQLAAFAMEEAVRLTRSKIGYIAFTSEDESVLTMHAWSQAAMAECAIQDKTIKFLVKNTGLWGEVIRQRRPLITNDFQAPNELKKGTPPGHVKVTRHMNAPIFEGEKIVIVAGVGNKEQEYDESDLRQLTLLMQGMWRIVKNKYAGEALRNSEKRLQAILEASPDPVIVYDNQGFTAFVNPAFTRLFGWKPEDVLGRRIPFVPEDQQSVTQKNIRKLYEEGNIVSLPTRRLTKAGKLLDIVVSAAGIRDVNGEMSGMVVNLTDITHTKQLEARLHQAQKMEAVGTLAGGIAHDFNNILGAVIGFSEMALEEARDKSDPTPNIEKILKAGERARDLVKRILTFSRQEEGNLKPLNLNTEVASAVELLSKTIPKMIAIETNLAQDLKPVLANTVQIEQVLLNLGSNAQDAMPEGGRLAIDTQNITLDYEFCRQHLEVEPGQYVLLQVSDTGEGMEELVRERIFEPFFTTKEVGKGTGLGLSTIYGIVKGLDGQISCYSEPGLGTTFKIYLPAYQEDISSPVQNRQQPAELKRGNETILLVDDENVLRDLGSQALSMVGYSVLTAKSGEQALEIYRLKGAGIGLVVMDLGMPGMGGAAALKAILEINPIAKVIIASGYAANGSVKGALQSGAVGFVAKPYRIAELLSEVRKILDQKN